MPIGRIGTLVSLRAALRDNRVAQAQVWQRHHVRVPGCAPASLQRVWRVPRLRANSDHDRPESFLKRSRRRGKSSGKTGVILPWLVRCVGITSPRRWRGSERERRTRKRKAL